MSVITETYKPSMTVGQVYARPYGSAAAPMPIGNVLELALERQPVPLTDEEIAVVPAAVVADKAVASPVAADGLKH